MSVQNTICSSSQDNETAYAQWLVRMHMQLDAMPSVPGAHFFDALFRSPKIQRTGTWLEFGVAGGHSLRRLVHERGHTQVYGFDSFRGLPEDWRPTHPKGTFADVPREVPDATIVIGMFADTLPTFQPPSCVTFVHIDCDVYSSTRTALHYVCPWLAAGAIVVFDEFSGYDGYENHEMRALYETEVADGLRYSLLMHRAQTQVAFEIAA